MKWLVRILCLVALAPLSAGADTYTVNNTNDWFWGSLRQAIEDANKHPGADRIVFAIGSGPKTIKLDTPLPPITDPVTIDGLTQPGGTGNPLVEIDGTKTGGTGLTILAPSTVLGLVINRFARHGIAIGDDTHNADGTAIFGCWIGVGLDGAAQINGWDGIVVFANDCVIGGPWVLHNNVISFNGGNGISIGKNPVTGAPSSARGSRTKVQNNIIGLDPTGLQSRANSGCGVEVFSGVDNLIGGGSAEGNLISSNGAEGVRIDRFESADGSQQFVSDTKVQFNKIGVSADGSSRSNGYFNGRFAGVASYAPKSIVAWNLIANNMLAGVLVRYKAGTIISQNSILNNVGLAIDLGAGDSDVGPTLNDPLDADTGGNGLLNFPDLDWAVYYNNRTTVTGRYRGAPNLTVFIEFFKNTACNMYGSGYGDGQTYLSTTQVTTDSSGNASFSVDLPASVVTGDIITATARNSTWGTSEFTLCRTVIPGIHPVVNGISRPGGRIGTPVTITGLHFGQATAVKFFDGAGWTVSSNYSVVDDNTITTTVPAGAKIGQIRVDNPYGSGWTPSFRVTPPAGDFTGEGQPDLVWRNYRTGQDSLWVSGGPGGGLSLIAVPDVNWKIEGTADFNNDGSHDIVWRNYATGEIGIWLMTGTEMTGWAQLPTITDTNWHIAAIGDFNRDGNPDLVWRNYATGDGSFWLMNGTSWVASGSLPNVPVEWKIEAARDFNLDGDTDLLWRNYATGEDTIWFMNGTSWVTFTNLPTIADPNWTIEGAFDWDQDGDYDLVWRNLSTGQNTVWLMIGAFWGGAYVDLAPLNDSDWRIEDY